MKKTKIILLSLILLGTTSFAQEKNKDKCHLTTEMVAGNTIITTPDVSFRTSGIDEHIELELSKYGTNANNYTYLVNLRYKTTYDGNAFANGNHLKVQEGQELILKLHNGTVLTLKPQSESNSKMRIPGVTTLYASYSIDKKGIESLKASEIDDITFNYYSDKKRKHNSSLDKTIKSDKHQDKVMMYAECLLDY